MHCKPAARSETKSAVTRTFAKIEPNVAKRSIDQPLDVVRNIPAIIVAMLAGYTSSGAPIAAILQFTLSVRADFRLKKSNTSPTSGCA